MGGGAGGRALTRLTSPAADDARDALLVVPVGATEQHGPHLPLSTDTDLAVALAERLACVNARVVIAPAVAYGSSGEHQAFAGTLSIGSDATELLLVELGRSATETWERVLYVSTHGGNAVPVARAVDRLRAEGRDVRRWSPRWSGDAHAGLSETSLMLTLDAERVARDRIADAVGAREPIGELMAALRRDGVAAVSPNGVLGDATGASAEHGAALMNAAVDDLVDSVRSWTA
ncbi:MAG TPA: mycofactocin biosynthesis peptidyl-dipeptidase MftE [Baekduia sp.]